MERTIILRRLLVALCVVLFVCLLLSTGCVMNALKAPQTPAEDPSGTTSAPTQSPTDQPTELPTEESTELPLTMPSLSLTAKHSFIYIVETDQFLMLKGKENDRIYPASLTKLFSTYVALLHMDPETQIKVGSEVYSISEGSSNAGLTPGDVLTVRQLVEAMMLPSGNDAAMTLATATGRVLAGDQKLSYTKAVARFVEEMNATAQTLGLTGSHFMNPDGYHDSQHYTTCADMQKIATLALNQPVLRQVMATQKVVLDLQYDYPGGWQNTNLLLKPSSKYYNPAAIGMKTGYTKSAGNCLMAAFAVEGKTVVVGIFGCPDQTDRFEDAQKIYGAYIER